MLLRNFLNPKPPTPAEIRAADLVEAQRDLLEHSRKLEFHAAIVPMLKARIERLEKA